MADLATIAAACLRRFATEIDHAAPRRSHGAGRPGSPGGASPAVPHPAPGPVAIGLRKLWTSTDAAPRIFSGMGTHVKVFDANSCRQPRFLTASEDFLHRFGAFRNETGDNFCSCNGEYMAVTMISATRPRRHMTRHAARAAFVALASLSLLVA